MTNNFKEGILLFDKPSDWTSHDVVAVSRKFLGTRKIGHSGTLDPMATGLLILLVGRSATKLQERFLKLPKKYYAVLKLGEETDTLDAHGMVTHAAPAPKISPSALRAAVEKLSGTFEHIVPKFSAKKIGGQAMHKLAREEREMQELRTLITVYGWENVSVGADGTEIKFTVEVSAGTYVRSLGKMLAEALGGVGHLSELRRLSSGEYHVDNALTMEELRTLSYDQLAARIKSV